MTAEPDWFGQAVAHLREPVDPRSDGFDQRIGAAVRRDRTVRRSRRRIGLGALLLAASVALWGRTFGPARTTVEFEIDAPKADRVSLVGDFNNWDQAAIPMRRGVRPGQWRTTVPLPNGWYRYAFLVDRSRWIADPAKSIASDADFGQPTSLLVVE